VNREQWLTAAVEEFRPFFASRKLEIQPTKVACGFPSKGGLSKSRREGECWPSSATFDGTRQIFITPMLSEPIVVLGRLMHELTHASLPDDALHGPKFKEAMKALQLEGKAKEALPAHELLPFLEEIAAKLGDYPNPALHIEEISKEKKAQAKKSFKLFCAEKRGCTKKCSLTDKAIGEDYVTTSGRKALALGFPHCPCGQEMEMETEDFKLYELGKVEA